jgi:hypothetical protein
VDAARPCDKNAPADAGDYRQGELRPAVLRRFASQDPPVSRQGSCAKQQRRGSDSYGVPLYDVQALLGHESFATTQR